MKNYSILNVGTKQHVICDVKTRGGSFPDADYMKTGKALCGILLPGETLSDFERKIKKRELAKIQKEKRLISSQN